VGVPWLAAVRDHNSPSTLIETFLIVLQLIEYKVSVRWLNPYQ